MPKGTDVTWLSKVAARHKSSPLLILPKLRREESFAVKHFADNVTYDVDGFVEKNRDTINEELLNVFRQSNVRLTR